MIFHPGPHAATWVRMAAATALALHVGGGSAGLVSGALSMAAPKGGRLHRTAGRVFVIAMLVTAAMASLTAPLVPERGNIVGGVFAFYLVLTGWVTMREPPGRRAGRFEAAAGSAALAIAGGAGWIGWLGSHSPNGLLDGQATQSAYVLGMIALLAAGGDLAIAHRGALEVPRRLRRHLWRMCVAVFIAAGSFFLGQQQVLPAFARGSPLLMAPVLAPLALIIFWQIRLRGMRMPVGSFVMTNSDRVVARLSHPGIKVNRHYDPRT